MLMMARPAFAAGTDAAGGRVVALHDTSVNPFITSSDGHKTGDPIPLTLRIFIDKSRID